MRSNYQGSRVRMIPLSRWVCSFDPYLILEFSVRVMLLFIFVKTESVEPFTRKIQQEELWLYKNPRTESYVPSTTLWVIVLSIPATALLFVFVRKRNWTELGQAWLSVSLALILNGVITNMIKLIVGRPRPDFFWRCFPDGKITDDMSCTGDAITIAEGRKSFPSGHSSFAFSALAWVTWYMMGKMQIFRRGSKPKGYGLVLSLVPLLTALAIALSRTCDYHHHWQDVVVGSCMGVGLSFLCYRQYYPALSTSECHLPHVLVQETSSQLVDVKTDVKNI